MHLTFELTDSQRDGLLSEVRSTKQYDDAVSAGVAAAMQDLSSLVWVDASGSVLFQCWAGDGDLPGWTKDFPVRDTVRYFFRNRSHGGFTAEEIADLRAIKEEFLRIASGISRALGE